MKRFTGILAITSFFFLFACTGETIETAGALQSGGGDAHVLTLTYTIPDAVTGTRSGGAPNRPRASYVESTGNESTVDGLHLLFFNSDTHGNGSFVASASATLKDANLKQNTVTVAMPAEVRPDREYGVLVVANLAKFLTDPGNLAAYLAAFQTKTYGQAWEELQVSLPTGTGIYAFPGGCLPMSGVTVKHAGSNAMSVNLLRAAVRIDVKVDEGLTDVTLDNVQLRNVATVVPFFRTQEQVSVSRAASVNLGVTGNRVVGGLYAVETSLDVSDNRVMLKDATCLLLDIRSASIHTGTDADRTWYRVNLNVNTDKMQFLKRNNAYRVVVTEVFTPGASTPEEAYHDKAMLIGSVTIPTDWKSSGVTPPDVTIQ